MREEFLGTGHSLLSQYYTGRFIKFSVITNIHNKTTKGPSLMELFTDTGKLKKFFLQLDMFDVCTRGDTAHIEHLYCQKETFSVFLWL
jgi:hypothetical protein